jgi:signal transduction histidine kinase
MSPSPRPWLVYRARGDIPYHRIFLAFGVFILACAGTHFLDVLTLWIPAYYIQGYVKAVTAIASVGTAVALPPLVPRVLSLIATAKVSERRAAEIRSRDEFLSVVAHEFKTPITALLGYTQLVQRRAAAQLAERDRRALQVIGEQATRLSRLVETLLDVSRLQLGRLHLEQRPLDLCRLVEQVVDELRGTCPAHRIVVACGDAVELVGDAVRLRQVLQNLIDNAVKYSPSGGRVRVSVARQGGWAHLAVADEGIGIPSAALGHIFERFYRAENIGQHGDISGFGIGLYLVQELVAHHGGRVAVESVEGQGSTFTVWLPLGAAPVPAAGAVEDEAAT